VAVELIVLGSSGSYGAPDGGACSGYLVREGDTVLWIDCGNGSFVNLQHHVDPAALTAVIVTHEHPDHCVDLYGLHVLLRYGLGREAMPLFAPAGAEQRLGTLVHDWGATFAWHTLDDGTEAKVDSLRLRFARTDHPPPTFAVEVTGAERRLVYTSDTGVGWDVGHFDGAADLVLSEATYLDADQPTDIHMTARQAGLAARAAGARRLVLTHIWPGLDRGAVAAEGSEAFGAPVVVAEPHLTIEV
jgi:ribonuclease BN (tRNA processing enzyme)